LLELPSGSSTPPLIALAGGELLNRFPAASTNVTLTGAAALPFATANVRKSGPDA